MVECPSGLWCNLGKVVWSQIHRGFKSRLDLHLKSNQRTNMKSKLLVFSQFFIIFLMILPLGQKSEHFELGVLFLVLGSLIGLAALAKNNLNNFNIRPDIKEGCTLVTSGVYAYIRHPMYSSVLVTSSSMLFFYPCLYEYVLYGLLLLTLLVKLFYEESLWKCDREEYLNYMKHTKRLIPFVF